MWMSVERVAKPFLESCVGVVYTPEKLHGERGALEQLVAKKPMKFLQSSLASNARTVF